MLCPEEPLHAMILRIAERIEDPEVEEEELQEWRECCLRCTAFIEAQIFERLRSQILRRCPETFCNAYWNWLPTGTC